MNRMAKPSVDVRRQLTPQMVDYDLLGSKTDWRPYLMFFHQRNFRSASINTDGHGFRRSHDEHDQPGTLPVDGDKPTSLLVGNSVSFGVGSTCDAQDITSHLSRKTGQTWLNFGGRGFGAIQELALFQLYHHLAGTPQRVVIMSGLNDLYLYYAPKLWDEVHGIFFFSETFHSRLNAPPPPPRLLPALLNRPIGKLRRLLNLPADGTGPDQATLERDLAAAVAARRPHRGEILRLLRQCLLTWAALADRMAFELTYVMQPMQPWCMRPMPPEEVDLLEYQDSLANRWYTLTRLVLDSEHHQWFGDSVTAICRELGIRFIDLNADFSSVTVPQWLFADRVHLTDRGQEMAADFIVSHLNAGTATESTRREPTT